MRLELQNVFSPTRRQRFGLNIFDSLKSDPSERTLQSYDSIRVLANIRHSPIIVSCTV